MKRFLVLLAVLSLVAISNATTVIPMSVERLTQASTHVLEGQAQESWTGWNAEHTRIFTYTRFQVTRALKGQAPTQVVVKQMGGRADGFEQKVAGVRQLQRGEQAVLFVHPSQEADGTMVITGLMQGSFRVVTSQAGEATVANGVEGVDQFQPATSSLEHYSGARMKLLQLETLVRAASERSGK